MNIFEKTQANINTAMTYEFAEGTEFRICHLENDREVYTSFSTFVEAYESPLLNSKYASEIKGGKIEIKRPENKRFQRMTDIKL